MRASQSQSAFESCTMHSESIQRYRMPRVRVTWMASRKFCGRSPKANVSVRTVLFASVVMAGMSPPQQWLRVVYGAFSPLLSCKRRWGAVSLVPTSITLVGSSCPSSSLLKQSVCLSRHSSCHRSTVRATYGRSTEAGTAWNFL